MNKLTNILLIGLLFFFSDINSIKIKKNYLKLSAKKNIKSSIEVYKERNTQQQTQQTKDQNEIDQEKRKIEYLKKKQKNDIKNMYPEM